MKSIFSRIMKETPYVTTIDLYESVTKECGPVPFETCYMMKRDNDVVRYISGFYF